MTADEETFLERWLRRKNEAAAGVEPGPEPTPDQSTSAPIAEADAAARA